MLFPSRRKKERDFHQSSRLLFFCRGVQLNFVSQVSKSSRKARFRHERYKVQLNTKTKEKKAEMDDRKFRAFFFTARKKSICDWRSRVYNFLVDISEIIRPSIENHHASMQKPAEMSLWENSELFCYTQVYKPFFSQNTISFMPNQTFKKSL